MPDVANIPEIWAKVKWGTELVVAEWGLILVVFLVAFSAFGLGRISATEAAKPAISVDFQPMEAEPQGMAIGGLIVASKSGTAYHFPWCGGAEQIKPANRIWFSSEAAAQEAGYRPSKSCKGLSE